jgi:hypothetical protein
LLASFEIWVNLIIEGIENLTMIVRKDHY